MASECYQKFKESYLDEDPVLLKDRFMQDGYLFVKKLFDPENILDLREQISSVLLKNDWIVDKDFTPSDQLLEIKSPCFYQYLYSVLKIKETHSLYTASHDACRLAKLLLGENGFCHPRKMIRVNYPFSVLPQDNVPVHQDFFYVKGDIDTLTFWLPLGNYPFGSSGLVVVPESHRRRLVPVKKNDNGSFRCTAVDVDIKRESCAVGSYSPGDAIVFHSLTLHGSIPNTLEQCRISLDFRVSGVNGFINTDELLPPYYPELPAWAEFSDEWGEEFKALFECPSSKKMESSDLGAYDAFLNKYSCIEFD